MLLAKHSTSSSLAAANSLSAAFGLSILISPAMVGSMILILRFFTALLTTGHTSILV